MSIFDGHVTQRFIRDELNDHLIIRLVDPLASGDLEYGDALLTYRHAPTLCGTCDEIRAVLRPFSEAEAQLTERERAIADLRTQLADKRGLDNRQWARQTADLTRRIADTSAEILRLEAEMRDDAQSSEGA